MSKYHSYLRSAGELISLYHGGEPFALFAKQYFRLHHRMGATDRKWILALCYGYFRAGVALGTPSLDERILAGFFLTEQNASPLLDALQPAYAAQVQASLPDKLLLIGYPATAEQFLSALFPFTHLLSTAISARAFHYSFLLQPSFFIRLRPGQEKYVQERLALARVDTAVREERMLALPAATRLDEGLIKDRHYVVQDRSSQRVATFFPEFPAGRPPAIWDCCAASGGKSLLAWDVYHEPVLTVSDIREKSLYNLMARFRVAGVRLKQSFQADLATASGRVAMQQHGLSHTIDLVIADVPCSGSGTWARTPEQRLYFQPEDLVQYTARQRNIVRNIIPAIAKGGYLLYITCSVFRAENEEQVGFIEKECTLSLVKAGYLEGYESRSDTLYAALFTAG